MPIATDAAFILPDDFAAAALMGRAWRPDLASPSVVAIRQDVHVMDQTGELLCIDRSGSSQGVRCVRLAERARLVGLFGRVFRDRDGRLTIAPLTALAVMKSGLELYRL